MISQRTERVIELAYQIVGLREELHSLEEELNSLFQEHDFHIEESQKSHANGRREPIVRNRLKILRVVRNSNDPISIKEIREKSGLSNSTTFKNVNQLLQAGELVRVSYGKYTISSRQL